MAAKRGIWRSSFTFALAGRPRLLEAGYGRAWVRQYQVSSWKSQQEAARPSSVADGVAPHIVGSPARKVAFQDVAPDSVKPAFSRRISIDIDGKQETFDSIFLRDSCKCLRCVSPSSTQKTFQTADIPATIEGSCQVTTELEDDEVALIEWKDDIPGWPEGHHTALPLDFLRSALERESNYQTKKHGAVNRAFWENKMITRDIRFLDYEPYMKSDSTLYKALKMLYTHGLVFLKNVPDTIATDSSASITSIIERIGNLRSTFYGQTWDVRSVPNAKNVAYTHVFLGMHMDLCYLDLTPQFQFLHSMRARAPGGESMFSDSFYAAERMRQEDPSLFEALCTFDVTYNYYNDGYSYRQVRPTIELTDPRDPSSPIKLINWSPPFQGPFAHDIGTKNGGKALRTYHAAAQRFDQLINDPANTFEYRMDEGDCVIFDNRRILHARRAFEAQKGERWLKGAYVDRDAYASKFAVLEEIYGSKP